MTDDRKAGIALIAGSVGGILIMAIHPRGALSLTTAEEVAHMSLVSEVKFHPDCTAVDARAYTASSRVQ
jgi:hypothetical protein